MSNIREVIQGTMFQGADEALIYTITTTPWGSTPTSISAAAFDEYADLAVTATVFPTNTPTATGDVISLSPLKALTVNHSYRIEVKFTDSGANIWEPKFLVKCVE